MRVLSLCLSNPVGTGGVCLCCGGVSGIGGEWVGGLDKGMVEWGGVMSV